MELAPAWDAHSCVPLLADYDLASLQRQIDCGAYYNSINVGMDFNPLADIVQIIAEFRKRISELDFLIQVTSFADIQHARAQGSLGCHLI